MRWIAVWVTGAVVAMLGALLLYLGPSVFVVAKGGTKFWLPAAAPVLLVAGIIGIGAGTAAMLRRPSIGTSSETTSPKTGIALSNMAVPVGLILSVAALLAVITVMVASRFVFLEALGPLFLAAFPVSLSGALISLLTLAIGTTRRRMAITGLVVGSFVAIGQVTLELGLMFGGGGD